MAARALSSALLVAALASIASGCAEPRACYSGDLVACTCDDGRSGFAPCDVASDAFGACGSCGVVPGLVTSASGGGGASSGGGSGGGATTKLGFLETCADDADCESGICHVFNAKGPKCTLACQSAADCPPPSPGCNNMGVCKAP